MPIYEYRCPDCGHEFEKIVKMSDPKPDCPECHGGEVVKKVSRTTFQLKGTGWYVTDYKSSGKSSSEKKSGEPSSSGESSSSESTTKSSGDSSSNTKSSGDSSSSASSSGSDSSSAV